MHGEGGWWVTDMWFFWILLIVFVVVIVRMLAGSGSSSPPGHPETPLEILKARYARGEIDDEEYERRRRELEK
jgi:putative membrane protein